MHESLLNTRHRILCCICVTEIYWIRLQPEQVPKTFTNATKACYTRAHHLKAVDIDICTECCRDQLRFSLLLSN